MRDYDSRRNELLDVAAQLFSVDGYEGTPVNAIIERAGVSKGTFYHYFTSKEEVVEGLAGRFTHELVEFARREVEGVQEGAPGGAVARLNVFFHASARFKMERPGVLTALFEAIFKPGNLIVRERINRLSSELVAPVLSDIILGGVEEGVFRVDCPEETAAVIIDLLSGAGPGIVDMLKDEARGPAAVLRRYRAIEQAIERILGLEAARLQLIDEPTTEMLAALVKKTGSDGKAGGT